MATFILLYKGPATARAALSLDAGEQIRQARKSCNGKANFAFEIIDLLPVPK